MANIAGTPDQPRAAEGPARFVSKLTPEEKVELMELVATRGLSWTAGARTWNAAKPEEKHLTREGVRKIVTAELDRYAEQMQGSIAAIRSQMSQQIDLLVQASLAIALGSSCSVCGGAKTIWVNPDEQDERQTCPKCNGTGRNENESVRLSAINTIKGLLERKAKLYGADQALPDGTAIVQQTVVLDVQGMNDLELEEQIKGFFAMPAPPRQLVQPAQIGSADNGQTSDLDVRSDFAVESAARDLDPQAKPQSGD